MSIRRLEGIPVVVLTGVENAGKTTLAEGIASALHWDLMPEAARTDLRVIDGTIDKGHLQHMLERFNQRLSALITTASNGIVCDTGALVLDMWSRHAFGTGLQGTENTMELAHLHLLCNTLPKWEPDPLRSMPLLADRIGLESAYRKRLTQQDTVFCEIADARPPERLAEALRCIRHHCAS
jgi:nicotinamide riboside kinase